MQIDAVGFDFDHTLGIDNKLERVGFLQLLRPICDDGGAPLGSLWQESASVDKLLELQRGGGCSIDAAVERFAAERGARNPAEFPERYKAIVLETIDCFVVPDPQAGELFAGLRDKRIPCAMLTNGWAPLQQRKAARVGFHGDVLVSAELGVQKPEPRAFAALAAALGTNGENTAYVGDNPRIDVQGAIASGLLGVWLDAENVQYPSDGPAPSLIIHTLTGLLEFL
ncbi:MAG: HAD family hydrolase [Candidatus Eremiobacteraeota bacterium]|nr:HAD family hydrolase [Candidatus Eremiobacteraeota bacterium]